MKRSSRLIQNKTTGKLPSEYGKALMQSIPSNGLLLAHTDLNWNTVRYLQVCENYSPNMTHLNIQLFPYPWFSRRQHHLYSNVKFPALRSGVSTNRNSDENAFLIAQFFQANKGMMKSKNLKQNDKERDGKNEFYADTEGIFIDIHAIRETDIDANGRYYGFTLIPWGLTYRALPPLSNVTNEMTFWYQQSLKQLKQVRNKLLPFAHSKVMASSVYPEGSWEHAFLCVFWDMHYQLGIHMLSYALSVIGKELAEEASNFNEYRRRVTHYTSILGTSSKLLWNAYVANEDYRALR